MTGRTATSEARDDAILFREQQRFTQWWIRLIAFGATAAPLLIFGQGIYQQLVRGRPWGDRPMGDAALLAVGLAVIAVALLNSLLLIFMSLTVEVRAQGGVWLQFWPFHLKMWRLDATDLTNIEAVTYRPIRDYGGWGIRYALRGKAYNVKGDEGVRFTYATGRHILIGSQQHEQFAAAARQVLTP